MGSVTFPATHTPGTSVRPVASDSTCSPMPEGWAVVSSPRPASIPARAAKRGPTNLQQRSRVRAVPGEEPVDPRSGRVARLASVDDEYRAPGSTKHQRAAEAGGATTDHHDVVSYEILGIAHLHRVLLLPEIPVP